MAQVIDLSTIIRALRRSGVGFPAACRAGRSGIRTPAPASAFVTGSAADLAQGNRMNSKVI
jgi:hypothetical protein